MSNHPIEVGALVKLTLVSGAEVEGAVFSMDDSNGMMILMECIRKDTSTNNNSAATSPASPSEAQNSTTTTTTTSNINNNNNNKPHQSFANPNMHVVNVKFVKNIEIIPDSGARLMNLPRNAVGDHLPVAENGDHKKLMNKLKAETKKKTGLYHDQASIDACDTYEYFLKFYSDLKWSTDPALLDKATKAANGNEVKLVLTLSGGGILLSGNAEQDGFSWQRPKVLAVNEESVGQDVITRLNKQAEACLASRK